MSFDHALRTTGFASSIEIPLTANTSTDQLLAMAKSVDATADAVFVPDNRFSHVHASPVSVCAVLLNNGIAPIMELGCRHRNRVALISELLGARTLGVESLLLVRGKKAPQEFLSQTKYVVDTNVTELLGTARNINHDYELPESKPFTIGSNVTAHDPQLHWNPERLKQKIQNGCQFVLTQICLDASVLERYVEHLVSHNLLQKVSLIVSAATFPSYQSLEQLLKDRTHLIISDQNIARLKSARNPEQETVKVCTEFLQAAKDIPGVSGVHLYGDDVSLNVAALAQAMA